MRMRPVMFLPPIKLLLHLLYPCPKLSSYVLTDCMTSEFGGSIGIGLLFRFFLCFPVFQFPS